MNREAGDTVNLYEQDYDKVEAITTSVGGELFFNAVLSGAIPMASYRDDDKVVIGKVEEENEVEIVLNGYALSSKQLLNIHRASNYSPLDCARGFWHELRTLHPELLKKTTVKLTEVRNRLKLALD